MGRYAPQNLEVSLMWCEGEKCGALAWMLNIKVRTPRFSHRLSQFSRTGSKISYQCILFASYSLLSSAARKFAMHEMLNEMIEFAPYKMN